MNFKGELVGQFSPENKLRSWNDKTSTWEDFSGEAFLINHLGTLEWYKDGVQTEIAS